MFRAAHKRRNLNLTEVSQTMTATATLTMVDEVRVVVPDSLDLITPYVLLEQQDWFEDEIKFLRHLLQPGQKVIDIGANYGVYALSMAQAVGPTKRLGFRTGVRHGKIARGRNCRQWLCPCFPGTERPVQ